MLEQRLHWDFQEEVGNWGGITFPKATNQSILEHTYREMKELLAADTVDNLAEECADIQLLLLHLAHRNSFDLFATAKQKFGIFQRRKWGKPDSAGVVEHIRERRRKPFKAVKRRTRG